MARLAVLFVVMMGGTMLFRSDSSSQRLPASVLLLYVGAEDCAPCRAWQAEDGAAFRNSKDFARLTYREVKSPHLLTVMSDDNWPDDVRAYRDQVHRDDGVPLWLVVADQVVVQKQSGFSQWRGSVLPTIRWLLQP